MRPFSFPAAVATSATGIQQFGATDMAAYNCVPGGDLLHTMIQEQFNDAIKLNPLSVTLEMQSRSSGFGMCCAVILSPYF